MKFSVWLESVEYSPEAIELAQKIVNGTVKLHNGSIDEPTVMYDAIWKPVPQLPVFINIKANLPGKGLGWIAFLDFLSKVNANQQFTSTDFTPAGKALFSKAVSLGLMKQLPSQNNIGNYTLWLVTADTDPILNKISSSSPSPNTSIMANRMQKSI